MAMNKKQGDKKVEKNCAVAPEKSNVGNLPPEMAADL